MLEYVRTRTRAHLPVRRGVHMDMGYRSTAQPNQVTKNSQLASYIASTRVLTMRRLGLEMRKKVIVMKKNVSEIQERLSQE